jgi:protein phosphatase
MSTSPQPIEPTSPRKPGGLWDRLRVAFQAIAAPPPASPDDVAPTWDAVPSPVAHLASEAPVATPVETDGPAAEAVPAVLPVAEALEAIPQSSALEPPPAAVDGSAISEESATSSHAPSPSIEPPASTAALPPCPACQAPRQGDSPYCLDCGYLFPPPQEAAAELHEPTAKAEGARRLAERYEVIETLPSASNLSRIRAVDHGANGEPTPVMLVCMKNAADLARSLPEAGVDAAASAPPLADEGASSENAPTEAMFDFSTCLNWPGLGWEFGLLARANHPGLPRVLNHFPDGADYYLVEETFVGRSLWDAWDDPTATPKERFDWLAEVAEALKELHHVGAILEGLRPESVVIKNDGHAAIADLSDLLPLPLPANPPIKATPYTAPELILAANEADARADLYSFGAMIYALYLGHELTEMDFERQGVPKPFVFQFPDAHPLVGRILMKTFVREPSVRFPTDEAQREDATGFTELIRVLRMAGESLGEVRLDIAGWNSSGLMRTNNEDAFALIHTTSGRLHHISDQALIVLADGMGGAAAGEVAAAMAIDGLQRRVLANPLFGALNQGGPTLVLPPAGGMSTSGTTNPDDDLDDEFADDPGPDSWQNALIIALRGINGEIFEAARAPGRGRRGMGCTAEVVYTDGHHLVVGHVGDSRTYHYSAAKLAQLTRDHTLVNRLVELGQLTPEEAANHARKNELQQALGGLPHVDPQTAHVELRPGDWVVVCSDGLTNHVDDPTLAEMIQRADSAEMLARRLVNLANLHGGSDNCTVVAMRVL